MWKETWIEKSLYVIFLGLLTFFYACIFAGSILGFLGVYKSNPVLFLTIIITCGLFIYMIKKRPNLSGSAQPPIPSNDFKFSRNLLYLFSFILIFIALLIPLARWPYSIAGDWFPWDAGLYHFPKAVELYRTGSFNDLSIAYGEYPGGYESLLAIALLISHDASLFGFTHIFIALFFILSVWLLARRYTNFHPATLFSLVVWMVLSDRLFRFFNFWQVFRMEILAVGKNDLLLAASILSATLFFPFPREKVENQKSVVPFCLSTMLGLAIKPNGALILVPLWLIYFAKTINNSTKKIEGLDKSKSNDLIKFLTTSLFIIPGLMWLIRNFLANGKIFSESVMVASKWSIAANITNSYFYRFIPKNLLVLIIFAIGFPLFGWILKKSFHWQSIIMLILIIGFFFTPVTAFFLRTDIPANINWRFGQAMLVYFFVLILVLIEDIGRKLPHKRFPQWFKQFLSPLLIISLFTVIGFIFRDAIQMKPENGFILHDQYKDSVGVDGYHSPYDYIQKNIHNSIVWVENGLPYYLYDEGFTNTVSRKKFADFILAIKTDWFGNGGVTVPSYFPRNWRRSFKIVYEVSAGVLYQRKKIDD